MQVAILSAVGFDAPADVDVDPAKLTFGASGAELSLKRGAPRARSTTTDAKTSVLFDVAKTTTRRRY